MPNKRHKIRPGIASRVVAVNAVSEKIMTVATTGTVIRIFIIPFTAIFSTYKKKGFGTFRIRSESLIKTETPCEIKIKKVV
jgi:hypothetical protein